MFKNNLKAFKISLNREKKILSIEQDHIMEINGEVSNICFIAKKSNLKLEIGIQRIFHVQRICPDC